MLSIQQISKQKLLITQTRHRKIMICMKEFYLI
jgi:hypothetical protein